MPRPEMAVMAPIHKFISATVKVVAKKVITAASPGCMLGLNVIFLMHKLKTYWIQNLDLPAYWVIPMHYMNTDTSV